MSNTIAIIASIVSMSTWLTPSPAHAQGLLVYYGSDRLAQANAHYREYDLSYYKDQCGLSLMSPSDLGKIVWVKLPTGEWYGPCLSVDAGARHDFFTLIYINHEIAEVSTTLRDKLNFIHGSSAWGEIAVSLCPPAAGSSPSKYRPPLKFDPSGRLVWREWPAQQIPVKCSGWGADVQYNGAQ